jgi:hypothetical protein
MLALFAEFFDIHVVVVPSGNFHQQRFCATLRTRNKTPAGVPFPNWGIKPLQAAYRGSGQD